MIPATLSERSTSARTVVPWCIALVLADILAFVPSAAAQSALDDWAAEQIGASIGRNIAGAINAAAGMRAEGARASGEIEAARRAYWQAVKTGVGVQAAKAKFANELWGKDMLYLILAIPEGLDGPRATVVNLIGGAIDGGIRPGARPYFAGWVRRIRIALGAETGFERAPTHRMVIPGPAKLMEALKAAERQEKAYLHARDWGELDASGLTFPWDTDARAHARMVLRRYSPLKPAEAVATEFRELVEVFGEKQMLAAAEKVRTARRNNARDIANPAALGVRSPNPRQALLDLLSLSSGRGYFTYRMYMGDRTVVPHRSMAEARRELDRFVWAYGAEAVDAAARFVLELPRRDGQIDIRHERARGLGIGDQRAIWTVLSQRHPEGRVRAMFAFHPEAKSLEDVDRLRKRLVDRYGEQAVANSTRALHGFWMGEPYGSPENQARRNELYSEASRRANLARGQHAHLYEADYPLLERILEEGAIKVLGEPGRRLTEDEKLLAEAEKVPEGMQRRLFIFQRRSQELTRRIDNDRSTYPTAREWLPYANVAYSAQSLQEASLAQRGSEARGRADDLAHGIRTLQLHTDLTGDRNSDVAQLARLSEEEAAHGWAALKGRWPEAKVLTVPARGGIPRPVADSPLAELAGTWTGLFTTSRGRRGRVTLRFAVPSKPGERIGTIKYIDATRDFFLVSSGFAGDVVIRRRFQGKDDRLYTLAERAPGRPDTLLLVTVRRNEANKLEVTWYPARSPGTPRLTASAILDRSER